MLSASAAPVGTRLVYEVILTGERGVGRVALIDWEDAHLIWARDASWWVDQHGYVRTSAQVVGKKRRSVWLHRLVMGLDGVRHPEIDHINGNKLDNRKENLRRATRLENVQNRHSTWGTSKYVGVSPAGSRWAAYGSKDGKHVHLGYFDTEDDAGAAAALFRRTHKPFSREARDASLAGREAPSPRSRKKTSRYLDVRKHSRVDKWVAEISVGGKAVYIGIFETEEAAGIAAREARERVARGLPAKPTNWTDRRYRRNKTGVSDDGGALQ